MKIEYDGRAALAITRTNPHRGWMFGTQGRSAKDRLNAGTLLEVEHKPRFMLDRSWPIFTMGSCFAREIENVLIRNGLKVLLQGHGVEGQYFASFDETTGLGAGVTRHALGRGALNKYTVHSMYHEISSTLTGKSYPHEGILRLSDEIWFDPNSAGLKNLDYDTTIMNRRKISDAALQIRQAKVVFFTLGLTETWFDSVSGMSMNVTPGGDWLVRMKERFHFVDYGFADTLEQMMALIRLIREHCNPEMKFIVTVSPIPLGSTFKDLDVVVASSGSKAILRAVADELCRRFDFVDYYPSYEMVTFSPRSLAFKEDQLHVNASLVGRITEKFMRSYYPVQDIPSVA